VNLESAPENSTVSLGAKIRQNRKFLQLTLTELAKQCNISPSFLSQIERDQANPSVATLHTIADVFGLPLATFFEEPTHKNNDTSSTETTAKVVRADQRKTLIYPGSGIRNELLSPDLQRNIQMMRVIIPPGAGTGEVPLVHDGEECGIVLQGQVEVWVGNESFILNPGDAIYQASTIPHRSQNIGDIDVIIIVAITPPSF
jgi:transcriptional regulator with XRE-family HTH domain